MPRIHLADQAVVRASGPDAKGLLQDILTCDMSALEEDEVQPGALLTPQGKVLFDFLISPAEDGFRFDLCSTISEDFMRRLLLYRLRAKMEIAAEPATAVEVAWGDDASAGLRDTRFPAAAKVRRIYSSEAATEPDRPSYNALRVAHGVAEGGTDFHRGDAFPHDILFDFNGGVALKKGCFVGQEVVSRMQHRDTARRRLVMVSAERDLPVSGTPVEAGGRPIGTLGTVAGKTGLAIIRTDRYARATQEGTAVNAGGVTLKARVPAYASFALGAAAG